MEMVYHQAQTQKVYPELSCFDCDDCIEDQKVFQRIKYVESGNGSLVYVQYPSSTKSPLHIYCALNVLPQIYAK